MLPPVATTARGAPGTVGIITASEGSESELVWVSWPKQNPRKLAVQTRSLALTVKVYRSPAVSPVTVQPVLEVEHPWPPRADEVTSVAVTW